MALTEQSLFLYGIEIPDDETALDFKGESGGPELQASLTPNFYTLNQLATEIETKMNAADPDHIYTVTIDRTVSANTQNRITITSSSAFFQLLFLTGSRADESCAPALGYNVADYTGATFYQNAETLGERLIPELVGYNYQPPELNKRQVGVVNVAASGAKDTIIFSTQQFIDVKFMYEPEAKCLTEWVPFWNWATQEKPFEFVPEWLTSPTDTYSVTLESTEADGKGLGFRMPEMLPQFPFQFQTGMIKMRLTPDGND